MQETEARASEASVPQPSGPVSSPPPPSFLSLLPGAVERWRESHPSEEAWVWGFESGCLSFSSLQAALPTPPTHVLICAPGRMRVSGEKADPNVQDGLALLPAPTLARPGAPASLPPSSQALPAVSLLGVLLGPPRASHEASQATRRAREGDGGDAGRWAPRAQAPRGCPRPLTPKGASAPGVSPAALPGPPRRPYLVGGGRGFFHGPLPFLPCVLLVWLHPMIIALPLLA